MENTAEQTQDIIKVKKTIGRPRIPDDQKKVYIQKPRPGYHLNYYHNSSLSKEVNCDLCNCKITKSKLKRHQTSKKCKEMAIYEVCEGVEEV